MKKNLSLILSAFLFYTTLNAQKIDSSFGTNGIASKDFPGNFDTRSTSTAVQADNKIVVAGYSNFQSPAYYDGLVFRYNEDGSADSSFATNGMLRFALGTNNDYATSVKIQPDGKIVVGGYTVQPNTSYDFFIVRLNNNGAIDSSFGTNGHVFIDNDFKYDVFPVIALQPDGKIVIAGGTGSNNSSNAYLTARVKANGVIDSSFGGTGILKKVVGTGKDERATSVLIMPDGKIVVGGYCHDENYDYEFGLLSYNTDGTLNRSFGTAGKLVLNLSSENDRIYCMTLSPDNKILAAGAINYLYGMVKLNSDGSFDTGFGNNGVVSTLIDSGGHGIAYDIKVLPGGKIILGGNDFTYIAYKSNGAVYTSFGNNGIYKSNFGFGSTISSFALQKNKLVASGWGALNNIQSAMVVRYTNNVQALGKQNSIAAKTNVVVYPNPANDNINISGLQANVTSNISITNERGEVFARYKSTGKTVQQINISSLKMGVYYVLVNNANGVSKVKFIKQ